MKEEKQPCAITTLCCCQKVAATHLYGHHDGQKNQIEMGWVVYSLDPLKKKY